MFQGTVFDNIAYGLVESPWQNAPREEQLIHVQAAAKLAYAHEFIEKLSDGYETNLGQRGSLLSGGERQRICIARAIVSQPKVLLLDEATSGLDPHAESIVQKAFDRASQGRTTLVIAHKLATVRRADNIVVMSQGRILEQGPHDDLIANGDTYARLVAIQNLNMAKDVQKNEAGEQRSSSVDAGEDMDNISKSLAQHHTTSAETVSTADKGKPVPGKEKELGLMSVVVRLIKDNPDLKWTYVVIIFGCLGGCKFLLRLVDEHR